MKRSTAAAMFTFTTAVLLVGTPMLSQAQGSTSVGTTVLLDDNGEVIPSSGGSLGGMNVGGMLGGINLGGMAPSQTQATPKVSFLIVDGVRVSATTDKPNPLDQVDPSKIVTIEVQKGPSAVKLYGPDVMSGVIVITTKKN